MQQFKLACLTREYFSNVSPFLMCLCLQMQKYVVFINIHPDRQNSLFETQKYSKWLLKWTFFSVSEILVAIWSGQIIVC